MKHESFKMSKISTTGKFSIQFNGLHNPFVKDPQLRLQDVVQTYIRAEIDNSTIEGQYYTIKWNNTASQNRRML